MPGDQKFNGLTGSQGPQKKSNKLEDNYVSTGSLEITPFSSYFFNELKTRTKVSEFEIPLSSFGADVEQDIMVALQNLSDQKSSLEILTEEERAGKTFDVILLSNVEEKYTDRKEVIDFIKKYITPLLYEEAEKLGVVLHFPKKTKTKTEIVGNALEGMDAREYLEDFFENKKDDTNGKKGWNWTISSDNTYIDMNIDVSDVGKRFAPLRELIKNFSGEDYQGGKNLIEVLEGKKIVGVNSGGKFFLKVIG